MTCSVWKSQCTKKNPAESWLVFIGMIFQLTQSGKQEKSLFFFGVQMLRYVWIEKWRRAEKSITCIINDEFSLFISQRLCAAYPRGAEFGKRHYMGAGQRVWTVSGGWRLSASHRHTQERIVCSALLTAHNSGRIMGHQKQESGAQRHRWEL